MLEIGIKFSIVHSEINKRSNETIFHNENVVNFINLVFICTVYNNVDHIL